MSSFEEYFYRNIANQIRKYRIEKGFLKKNCLINYLKI